MPKKPKKRPKTDMDPTPSIQSNTSNHPKPGGAKKFKFKKSIWQNPMAIVFIVGFAALGTFLLLKSFAATPFVSQEVENGSVTAPATIVNDATASGGKAVAFGAAANTCTGVALNNGQADINAHASGTTYCVSGVHNNWDLTPKSGDKYMGDGTAVLDGTHTTLHAFEPGTATNVTLENLEVRNYSNGNQSGAIQASGTASSAGWILRNLLVHDNGTVCPTSSCGSNAGGYGVSLGINWQIIGGRYYNNRQAGFGAGGANGSVIDGAEIDHNNFKDDTYTTANHNCDDEAGGGKWAVTTSFTVKNSIVHDNACRGLWADIDTTGTVLTNNHVYNNWADGIMIEISRGATITGNTVTGNGFKETVDGASSCFFSFGAGITLSTSGHTNSGDGTIEISGNDVENNCMPITGADQVRDNGATLMNINVHDNKMVGSTDARARNKFGMFPQRGSLSANNITLGTGNTLSGGIVNCGLTCN